MELIKFRINGHAVVKDSQWLAVGPGLNILDCPDVDAGAAVLRALQTVNPPRHPDLTQPFADFPAFHCRPTYTRWVIPTKKTAAIGIFAADPAMTSRLAVLDPLFYAVDRIEVGRRRDHSRWLNFVELANSSRWSEAAPVAAALLGQLGPDCPASLRLALVERIDALAPTERLKGELAASLTGLLQELTPFLPGTSQPELQRLHFLLGREALFLQARTEVLASLPVFLCLSMAPTNDLALFIERLGTSLGIRGEDLARRLNDTLADCFPNAAPLPSFLQGSRLEDEGPILQVDGRSPNFLSAAGRMEAEAMALVAAHRLLLGCSPILLFEADPRAAEPDVHGDQLACLLRLSRTCQCLLAPNADLLRRYRQEWPGRTDATLIYCPWSPPEP